VGLLTTIREHAAVASGNFAAMIRDTECPALPAAVSRLLAEINRAEPDIARLEALIGAEPAFAAKVLAAVNASQFGLRSQVMSVRQAITLLGLERVRSLVLGYAVLDSLPREAGGLFDHEGFWTDALLRAQLARELSRVAGTGEPDLAFTAMLVADASLPVLLTVWRRYYEPVVAEWSERNERLSTIETMHFGWNHSQATSWLLHHWEFPEELVCLAGAHDLTPAEIRELGLGDTAALPVALAALLPSILKPQEERFEAMVEQAAESLGLAVGDWPTIGEVMGTNFAAAAAQFGLSCDRVREILDLLRNAAHPNAHTIVPAEDPA
jgi:HD-like signal output (HDOD) protein